MAEARTSALESLKGLLSVLAGLTVTNSLLIVYTGGSYSRILKPGEMDPYAILCCVLLLANLVRFYHGSLRCLDEFHSPRPSRSLGDSAMAQPRRGLGLDFFLAYAKATAFAAASFYIGQPSFFCWVIITLLSLEIVWFLATRSLSPTARTGKRQLLWLVVNFTTVLVFLVTKAINLQPMLGEQVYVGLLATVFSANTIIDLWLSWAFYFPRAAIETSPAVTHGSPPEPGGNLECSPKAPSGRTDTPAQMLGPREGKTDA
jgi:hypothetical protein